MTISDFKDYLLHEKNYSQHTIVAYAKDLEQFLAYLKQNHDQTNLESVNYSLVRSFIIHLSDKGVSNKSINRKISSLKSYYTYLLKTKQIEVSPLNKHKALKTEKKLQIPFSQVEIEQVLAAIPSSSFEDCRNKLLIELLYSTGMRRAELINIRLQNIDIESASIKIVGKRNKERIIPLLPSVINTLKIYLDKRSDLEYINNSTFLFLTKKGRKLYGTLVYRVVNSFFAQVSTKVKRSPHIIRHSFATHLLNEGANLNAVKELLGHASLASTQVYTHNNISELRKVYKKAHPRND